MKKLHTILLTLVVLGLLFGTVRQAKAAESHNMTTEFSSSSNPTPNGVWTYGHYTGLDKSTFQAFTGHFDLPADLNTVSPECDPPTGGFLDGWRDTTDPNVIKNTGATHVCPLFGTITFNAGQVTFGPAGGPAVVRATVPSPGDWLVVATFTGVQVGNEPGATAWIHEGTSGDTTFFTVAATVANAVTSGYNQLLTGLPAGATIDFVVGNGSKTTEVTAIITSVPTDVAIDIKFLSNPNGYNCKKHGVLPVTIFGTATLDVTDIDISTLRLALAIDTSMTTASGPVDSSIADRGDPSDAGIAVDGVDVFNQDTFDDLDVAFDSQAVAALIVCSGLTKGDPSPTLVLIGEFNDGSPLESSPVGDVGIDQLAIKNK